VVGRIDQDQPADQVWMVRRQQLRQQATPTVADGDRVVALVVDDGIAAQLGGQPQPPASSAVSGTIVAR